MVTCTSRLNRRNILHLMWLNLSLVPSICPELIDDILVDISQQVFPPTILEITFVWKCFTDFSLHLMRNCNVVKVKLSFSFSTIRTRSVWSSIRAWRISFCWIVSVIATISWRYQSLIGPISRFLCQFDTANWHHHVLHLQYISNVIAILRAMSLQYRYNIRMSTRLINR